LSAARSETEHGRSSLVSERNFVVARARNLGRRTTGDVGSLTCSDRELLRGLHPSIIRMLKVILSGSRVLVLLGAYTRFESDSHTVLRSFAHL